MQYRKVTLIGRPHLQIRPLSDLHLEAQEALQEPLQIWRQWILAKPNRYWIGLGDFVDAATRDSPTSPHGQRLTLDQALDWLAEFLAPVAHRCLEMLPGNHEARLTKFAGSCPARQLARRIGVRYSKSAIALEITVNRQGMRSPPPTYRIYAIHGTGGGRRPGGKANRLEDMSGVAPLADLMMCGHGHTPMVLRDRTLAGRERVYVMTGSFLGYAGYARRAGYRPSSPTMPVVTLAGDEHRITVEL